MELIRGWKPASRAATYKHALLALVVVQLFSFAPVIFQGKVIFPHSNDIEATGIRISNNEDAISNRKFTDNSNQFIPEINAQIRSTNKGFVTSWFPNVQFGRPANARWQSRTSLITNVLMFLTKDPFYVYTYLTLIIVTLTGIFAFLFLKELNLHPIACFSVAAWLSAGSFAFYWLTFVQFLSIECWTLGLLWLIVKFTKRQSFLIGLGISFFVYNLMLMGRIQTIIREGYVIIGFALVYVIFANYKASIKYKIILLLALCFLIGFISVSPYYLDFYHKAVLSSRLSGVDDEFFLSNVSGAESLSGLAKFLHVLIDPFWFGNPISDQYPLAYNGRSFTMLFVILALLTGIDGLWRRVWPWQLLCLLCIFATLWPPAYLFMVKYMGFNLSRARPIGAIAIPLMILAAYAIDYILSETYIKNNNKIKVNIIVIIWFPVLLLVMGSLIVKLKLDMIYVAVSLLLAAGVTLFVFTRKALILIVLVLACIYIYGTPMSVARSRNSIYTRSSLIDTIATETRNGGRFAWVGDSGGVVPPNQELLYGIRSIHSYDSISSRLYQRQVRRLDGKLKGPYGRYFLGLRGDSMPDAASMSYTGLSLLLSKSPIELPYAKIFVERRVQSDEKRNEAIYVYKITTPVLLEAQVVEFNRSDGNNVELDGPLFDRKLLPCGRIENMSDYIKFKVTESSSETLLFISQQFHDMWHATARGERLETVLINDFYQGVLLPPHVGEVEIQYMAYSRLSWIPQVFFVTAFTLLMVGYIRRRLNERLSRS